MSRNPVYRCTNGASMMRLRVDDPRIRRHTKAQRTKRSENHVASIVNNFRYRLDGPIIVSAKNGWFNIVDGDHRFTARQKLFELGKVGPEIDAMVFDDLDASEDHEVFYGYNQMKKQLDSRSKWYNGYHGKEPNIVGAINLITKLGFSCSIGPNDDTVMITNHAEFDWQGNKCIGTLVKLYEKCPQLTEQWLHGILAWRSKNGKLHPDTMNVELLRGTFQFVKYHCADLSNRQIRRLFARTNPSKIRAKAVSLQLAKSKCRNDAQYVEAMARATKTYRKDGRVVIAF